MGSCDTRHRSREDGSAHRRVRWVTRWLPHVTAGTWRRLTREVFLVLAFAAVYEEIRNHMVQAGAAASSHALLVVSAEREMGLFHERAVQDAFIGSDTITDTFNAYYGGTHFLIPAFVLVWLMFRHPAHYGRARTALAVTTGLGFLCFWLFPLAPPRLLPARFGIVDTLVSRAGSGHIDSTLINAAGDQYASMPSLHVAWAVWCALALYPVLRHWALRALVVAYPIMTTLVVVATGNHFFLDAVAGTLLAFVTWAAVTWASAWLAVRIAVRWGQDPSRPADFLLPARRIAGRHRAAGRASQQAPHPALPRQRETTDTLNGRSARPGDERRSERTRSSDDYLIGHVRTRASRRCQPDAREPISDISRTPLGGVPGPPGAVADQRGEAGGEEHRHDERREGDAGRDRETNLLKDRVSG